MFKIDPHLGILECDRDRRTLTAQYGEVFLDIPKGSLVFWEDIITSIFHYCGEKDVGLDWEVKISGIKFIASPERFLYPQLENK